MVTQSNSTRTWLVTGAGRGLGRAFAVAALEAGDRVAAVVRSPGAMDDLDTRYGDKILVLPLDVTDRDAVFHTVATAAECFGRLDVIVNNAGIISVGMVEEFTETEARRVMETNFFGALWVSQAAMSHLRRQGSGHIIQISSIAALGGFPTTGIYSASKFALEGMSEALAMEAAQFGIKLTIVQPGGYWTNLYAAAGTTAPLHAYGPLRTAIETQWAEGSVDSDPRLAAEALQTLVDSDDPPLRLLLGSMVYDLAFDLSHQRLSTWAGWEKVSRAAEHAIPEPPTHHRASRAADRQC
jgi:NAD(P)-dependent dehydrogenase (short-subunit alcohol dehydrogenase family)